MRRATKLSWGLLLALSLLLLGVVPTGAQGEVFVEVDRAQERLEQLLIDLDASQVSQEQLYLKAETVLATVLTVQEQLKALLGEGWDEVRALAEALYFQAEKGSVEEMKETGRTLHDRLTQIKETVSAWEEGGASLFIKDYGAYPGDEVSVPVLLQKVPPGGVSGFDLELGFLPDVVEATSVTFPRGSGRYEIDNEAGRILLSASNIGLTSDAPSDQTLAEVGFTVRGKEKDVCLFSFQRVELYGADGEKVPSTGSNGSLRVLVSTGPQGEPGGEEGPSWTMVLALTLLGIVVAGGLILIGARLVLARR